MINCNIFWYTIECWFAQYHVTPELGLSVLGLVAALAIAITYRGSLRVIGPQAE